MNGIQQKAWLTSALTDKDIGKALTLAFSLRRVLTCYKLAVIVSSKVSNGLREALSIVFDFVFALEEYQNTAGLDNEEFVQVFALTLKGFEKCVMLSPNMMVVKNCDELLQEDAQQQFFWNGEDDNKILPIFTLRPSILDFKNLIKQLEQRNSLSVSHYLNKWTGNEVGNVIDHKYNRTLKNGMLLGNEEDVSIINLFCEPNQADFKLENYGLIGQRVMELWKNIQKESVSQMLEQGADFSSLEVMAMSHQNHEHQGDAIAIIGMSCRFPGANSLEEFWDILIGGKDATGNPPDFRWRREQSSRPTNAEQRKTNAGFLKCSVDDFDAKFFGISPKEIV